MAFCSNGNIACCGKSVAGISRTFWGGWNYLGFGFFQLHKLDYGVEMMKISIVIATCGRHILFSQMLDSLYHTIGDRRDVETVAVIDESYVNREMFTNWGFTNIMDFSDTRRGAIWAWNRGLQISTGDIIVPAGDDQLFHPSWLDYALESHQNQLQGYGVVGMNDLAYDGTKQTSTMLLFDRKFCKDVMGGVIAPPVYHYFCVDSEWNEKSKQMHKFYWDERAKVEHLHPAHGKRPKDDLDIEREQNDWMRIDNEIFEQRKAQGFPITWEPLI